MAKSYLPGPSLSTPSRASQRRSGRGRPRAPRPECGRGPTRATRQRQPIRGRRLQRAARAAPSRPPRRLLRHPQSLDRDPAPSRWPDRGASTSARVPVRALRRPRAIPPPGGSTPCSSAATVASLEHYPLRAEGHPAEVAERAVGIGVCGRRGSQAHLVGPSLQQLTHPGSVTCDRRSASTAALARTALVRAGCPTAGPTPSNWCHSGVLGRPPTPRWHHSTRAHPALAPLGAGTPRTGTTRRGHTPHWHHSTRTHPALAPLDADTPRAGTTRREGPGRVRVGGSSRRRPKPACRPAPRALRPLHPR